MIALAALTGTVVALAPSGGSRLGVPSARNDVPLPSVTESASPSVVVSPSPSATATATATPSAS